MVVSQQEMSVIWREFVKKHPIDQKMLRPEILNSWKRCLGKVDPFQQKNQVVLPQKQFEDLCARNKEFLEISGAVMEDLHKFVRGSGFVIVLSEGEGYILRMIGDLEVIHTTDSVGFVPGAKWSESVMGTNAIGTCIIADTPLQIYAYEHWATCVQGGVCSCAPIHDPDSGQIIGALGMTAVDSEKVHSHTLGLVFAAVRLIEGQIAARRNWLRSQLSDQYKALIMESISDGLMAVDSTGTITHINQKAINFLNFYGNPLGENIFRLLKKRFGEEKNYKDLISILNSQDNADGEFVTIHTQSGSIKYTVTSRCLFQHDDTVAGKTIVIQQVSRTKKTINRVIGNQAKASFPDIIGKNRRLLECIETGIRAAKTSSNVLLIGETGTGKDLFAQSIHNQSPRSDKPYVAINCGAIPRDLLGSELFGFTGGSFTGARKGGNPGKFELADHGTIFLDEITEMPLDMQVSLLRFLEDKTIMRIGGREGARVDVRVIAACNKDLSLEVASGNFRSDLYYRLNVVSIEIPPLRDRKEDLPLLIEHLTRKIAQTMGKAVFTIDPEFIRICLNHNWPGNVRELQNILEKAVCLSEKSVISSQNLPAHILGGFHHKQVHPPPDVPDERDLREMTLSTEKEFLLSSIQKHAGNKLLTAQELGISRSSLYRKLGKD